jgi:cell wall-associated NlpC family hydrolase
MAKASAKTTAAKAAAQRAARIAKIRSSIVSVALSKVGSAYIAGHAGPRSFDCSGLALYVYQRAAGISLPHYSYSQYGMSTHISSSSLRPGDLVFFFRNGAHHVGIYIGGGKMVNAVSPSSGVRVDYIFGPWYGSHYTGAGRILQ